MSRVLDQEWFRSLAFALIIVGIGLALLGGWQFVDASVRVQDNPAYQLKNAEARSGGTVSDAQAQGIIAADIEFRRLMQQRSNGLILVGGGLALLAIGWIGFDAALARNRKVSAPPQSPA